jgi:hypothetical protein
MCRTEEELEILYRALTKRELEWQIVILKKNNTDKMSY